MFKIDFSSAISFYLSFPIVLVFAWWLFYNSHRDDADNETEHLHQCPYCTYVFFNYGVNSEPSEEQESKNKKEGAVVLSEDKKTTDPSGRFLLCPRCQSYINLDDMQNKKEP